MIKFYLTTCLYFVALVSAVTPLSAADQAVAQAPSFGPSSFYTNFTDLKLTDQNANAFDLAKLAGKVVLINFIFTSCVDICPLQTHKLKQVQSALPADVRQGIQFISVTLDPKQDKPEALKAYAQRMGIDLHNWSFVTTTEQDINRLVTRLHLAAEDAKGQASPLNHRSTLWLIDGKGRLLQRYNGEPVDHPRILNELVQLYRMPV